MDGIEPDGKAQTSAVAVYLFDLVESRKVRSYNTTIVLCSRTAPSYTGFMSLYCSVA